MIPARTLRIYPHLLAILFSAVSLIIAPRPATACAFDTLASMDTVFRRLAHPAGFERSDFNLLVNFRGETPPAPAAVLKLLRDPRSADSLLPALRRDLSEATAHPSARAGAHSKSPQGDLPGGMLRAEGLWPWIGAQPSKVAKRPAQDGLLESRTKSAENSLHAYLRPLTLDQIAFLSQETPGLFRPETEDTLLNPIEREIARVQADALTDSLMRLAGNLSMDTLALAASQIDALLSELLEVQRSQGAAAVLTKLQALRKTGVSVTIGTSANETHTLERGIVWDPGGNDRYVYPDSARPGTWLLVVDLAGADTYLGGAATKNASTGLSALGAAAFLSVQVLADLGGNDTYRGGDFAFGASVLGFSRLYDGGGDDTYTGRCASLGFAFRGIGILQDRGGDDVYSSVYLSQGASSSFGLAVLLDEGGDDRYESRPEFVDDLRYREHFLSLSQGFSTGMAPRHGGGIAVLWDRSGADRYTADIFGQGAGYWFAWGLLMDDGGDDSLQAHQYAQGAGVHFAAGMLLDEDGNDVRISKGVSQGCGHDGGFGFFADAEGDDRDSAVDMSAGAGSANGLGVRIDFTGNDTYAMGNPVMTLGHGDMRRDRGSLGFFLDLGGRDVYSIPSAPLNADDSADNLGTWRTYDGKRRGHGYGLDAE
jgi:hypothetical protein